MRPTSRSSTVRGTLTTANPLRAELTTGVYAAHVVAAATVIAVDGGNVGQLFRRMLDLLKSMHDVNPTFGSLRVRHPDNLSRDRAYIPFTALVPRDDSGIRAAS